MVVRTADLPRTAPRISSSCISRSTVHRATRVPSRRSCAQTLSAPYTRRFSVKTRVISGLNASPRTRRADGGRAIAAWYVAGANASTRQIGSMPQRSRWVWMKVTAWAVAGRAPAQKKRTRL